MKTLELFEENRTLAWPYLADKAYPWEVIPLIKDIILEIGKTLDPEIYHHPAEGVWIAKSASVAPSAAIGAPTIIGENAQIRHGAYIRGSALIGEGCVVGNSTELKNCILFDKVQVPHFNYVGDAILGYKAHLGAGAITSNVKGDRTLISIKNGDEIIETGCRKLGGILGDYAEVGCNAVINPGCIIGQRTVVYPTACVRGVIPSDSVVKTGKDVEIVARIPKES
ncbi:MAG: UDP-N-acetylglucosamine pyrophosphorylase [Ruminococcaceae bacterium]|nr:UDP-N-acetylglucosamine pyrophosphorylase [Oscillospiraceae bacterium]